MGLILAKLLLISLFLLFGLPLFQFVMSLFYIFLILAILCTVLVPQVYASLYIVEASSLKTCHGGKSCTFQWLDDGVAPLLTEIGPCHVALYHGQEDLIQQIHPVDVSTVHSLQFTPNPMAGPNSNQYYINFTSVNLIGGSTYNQFSSFFQLDQMTGSLNSAIPSLTSSIPVPSSILSRSTSQSVVAAANTPLTLQSFSSSGMMISRTSSIPSSSAASSATGTVGNSQSSSAYRYTLSYSFWIFACSVGFILKYHLF